MASNKRKFNIHISSLSSEEIHALLGNIDIDYEEIDNLINNFDTIFVNRTAFENSKSDISEAVMREKYDSNGSIEGLLTLIKIESERYAAQNGGVFQTTNDESAAFLDINILMEVNGLAPIKDFWSVEEGLGNPLIQNTMTRARFWEIPKTMHFADKLQNLPTRDKE